MRFFRIPAFTGIETHRDDADRGSLRVVEGCVPHGPGGLRSGPVWKKIGDVDLFSSSDQNHMHASDDGKGNSIVYVSRTDEVHDIAVFSTEHTEIVSLGASYAVADPTPYRADDASVTPIGNRLYAMGDGSAEAAYVGKGPPTATASVFPDEELYDQEWSRFPSCKFYVQGPKKTIFASGNPDKPLTVYISEPAGLTNPYRDSPHSTELTNHNPGVLSTVDILSSNASKITALSTRGDQVVVHTDKGCHLLYSPKADQADTGYRVEQVPATNFSGAVNSQVVSGESGSQHFWMGHDGQIYKDEAASRGAEDFRGYADAAQANWKAKGQWEKEHPVDLSDAFATYDPQSGMYWVYTRSDEYDHSLSGLIPEFPLNLQSSVVPDAPGVPPILNSNSTPSAPSAPLDLDSISVPDLAPTPTLLNSTLIPDPPSIPLGLTSIIVPEKPEGLTSTVVFEPGAPRLLTSVAIPDAPGAPRLLTSVAIPDAPGAPRLLTSAITAVDAPGTPRLLTSAITAVDAPGAPRLLTSAITAVDAPVAPGAPRLLTSAITAVDPPPAVYSTLRNNNSVKLSVTDWLGNSFASNAWMTYGGLRDTNDVLTSPTTATFTKLSAAPTGTQPSWFLQYNNSVNSPNYAYIIGNPAGSQFFIYNWNGDPNSFSGALALISGSIIPPALIGLSRTVSLGTQVTFTRNFTIS